MYKTQKRYYIDTLSAFNRPMLLQKQVRNHRSEKIEIRYSVLLKRASQFMKKENKTRQENGKIY